jgi:AAA+ ATPase superfamily predicted ATPase
LLQQLLDASVLAREIPFGESLRSTKRTRYHIQDPAIRFWFGVFSQHRTRWRGYAAEEKTKLLRDHASTVFEDFCRGQHPDAARYWEAGVEFDFVRVEPDAGAGERAVVSEVKWKTFKPGERAAIEKRLAEQWPTCALSRKHPNVRFETLDAAILKKVKASP